MYMQTTVGPPREVRRGGFELGRVLSACVSQRTLVRSPKEARPALLDRVRTSDGDNRDVRLLRVIDDRAVARSLLFADVLDVNLLA